MNMDNSKITSLNDKHFLSVDEQIRLLQNREFKISNKVFFQWHLTKYNYQTLINGYNDFFSGRWFATMKCLQKRCLFKWLNKIVWIW